MPFIWVYTEYISATEKVSKCSNHKLKEVSKAKNCKATNFSALLHIIHKL